MITHFTTWSREKGEHEQETTTAETLSGYTAGGLYSPVYLKLFAIGGNEKNGFSANWDIYANSKGTLYSIARPGTGCRNTYFGDANHIKRLMRQGYFNDTLTPYGQELMNIERR